MFRTVIQKPRANIIFKNNDGPRNASRTLTTVSLIRFITGPRGTEGKLQGTQSSWNEPFKTSDAMDGRTVWCVSGVVEQNFESVFFFWNGIRETNFPKRIDCGARNCKKPFEISSRFEQKRDCRKHLRTYNKSFLSSEIVSSALNITQSSHHADKIRIYKIIISFGFCKIILLDMKYTEYNFFKNEICTNTNVLVTEYTLVGNKIRTFTLTTHLA